MARIPDDVIERLKTDISLQRLAETQGITLKKHGQDFIGLCPFHDDKEPSLVITPEKNLWHCLGACQSGGSVIDWVMKAEAEIMGSDSLILILDTINLTVTSSNLPPTVNITVPPDGTNVTQGTSIDISTLRNKWGQVQLLLSSR